MLCETEEKPVYLGVIDHGPSYAIHQNCDRFIPTVYSKDKTRIITTNDPEPTASKLNAVQWILCNIYKVMKEGGQLQ